MVRLGVELSASYPRYIVMSNCCELHVITTSDLESEKNL